MPKYLFSYEVEAGNLEDAYEIAQDNLGTFKVEELPDDPPDGRERISMASGCNPEGKPFVHYFWEGDTRKTQWTPEVARQHAMNLLHCAEAAEHDACVFGFLKNELKLDPLQVAQVIGELRNYRRDDGDAE